MDPEFRVIGYIDPNDVAIANGAEHKYMVDEEGFDGCTLAIYVKVEQDATA